MARAALHALPPFVVVVVDCFLQPLQHHGYSHLSCIHGDTTDSLAFLVVRVLLILAAFSQSKPHHGYYYVFVFCFVVVLCFALFLY